MKKYSKIVMSFVIVVGSILMAQSALATMITPGQDLQEVLNGITSGEDSSIDVTKDFLSDNMDSYWSTTATGGSLSVIIQLAQDFSGGEFGVYMGETYQVLFDSDAAAGNQVSLSIMDNGEVLVNHVKTGKTFSQGDLFGYYLQYDNNKYHSDSLLNNGDDRMFAYQGKGDTVQIDPWGKGTWTSSEYVLAFETSIIDGTADYTDLVVMVESVEPVPEPATIVLFGAGLIGLAAYGRARKRKK